MIGFYAILFDVAFVILGPFLLAGASWSLIDCRRRRKPANVFYKNKRNDISAAWFVIVFILMWLGVLSNQLLHEARLHSDLSHLRPDTVDRIQIGKRAVTDKGQIAEIVGALNRTEGLALRSGNIADNVPFVVTLTSGTRYNYEVARYLRGEGAVLMLRSSEWNNGEVFCLWLPASLKKAQIALPDCSTYFGKPERCAVQSRIASVRAEISR